MKPAPIPSSESLWAITAYFNPMRYQRRLWSYRLFREQLKVPLLTVELGYGDEFELHASDADILIQRRGADVMWQKERLLNVALKALPDSCRYVMWVDCDLVFGAADWPEKILDLLGRFPLVQAYSKVHHLPQKWAAGDFRTVGAEYMRSSAASVIASGVAPCTCIGQRAVRGPGTSAMGHAWAARRELIERHSLYDACIIGGGDGAMAGAAFGCFAEIIRLHVMSSRQTQRYLAWAKPYFDEIRGAVGFVDCDIFHLWHGDFRDRHSPARYKILQCFDFDPFADIALDGSGCWRWNTDKPQLHHRVKEYFAMRKEDG